VQALRVLITKANLKTKSASDFLQILIFKRLSQTNDKQRITSIALYSEFCLQRLNNKYWDRLRDLLENEVANHPSNLLFVLGLIRRIARC